jgi:hypothetical protein
MVSLKVKWFLESMRCIWKSASKASEQAIKPVDPKYYEGNLTRTVKVESGKELVIALD